VRELQNVLIRYCATQRIDLESGTTSDVDLKPRIEEIDIPKNLNDQVEKFEREIIKSALAHNRWHRGTTAKMLKIDRKTLFNKMKRYHLIS
jgi:DNA-binding NtrC family response regulator